MDTDGDGVGNNADPDDDGDGYEDADDAFPLDPEESVDTDGEWLDTTMVTVIRMPTTHSPWTQTNGWIPKMGWVTMRTRLYRIISVIC